MDLTDDDGGNGGNGGPLAPAIGEAESNPDFAGGKHADGWERATDRALDDAAAKWPKPKKYNKVEVTFEADVSLTNPGTIDTYRVILTPAH